MEVCSGSRVPSSGARHRSYQGILVGIALRHMIKQEQRTGEEREGGLFPLER